MRILALAMVLLLLFSTIGSAAEEENLKNIKTDPSGILEPAEKRVISLSDAKKQTEELEGVAESNESMEPERQPEQETITESVDGPDILSESVSKGNSLFLRSLIDGMYSEFENSEVTEKYGSMRGAIITVVTFVPNPYDDPFIQELYKNYNNLAIYFVVLFIIGEWFNRRAAQLKITTSVFGEKDLSQSRFIGGICMCMLALAANIIYMFALDIIEALSGYAVMPSIDMIAPTPENLLLYACLALFDLVLFVFFAIRYLLIYIFAVLCSLIAVLLVPESTREFAFDAIEKIIRILMMQPVAILFTVIGIHVIKGLPVGSEPLGTLCLTILVFLVCWYCLVGKFTLLKQGIKFAVTKGVM